MRRYRVAVCAALAALPLAALAACGPTGASSSGAPASAPSVPAGPSGSDTPAQPPAGDGSDLAFCQQFSKAHSDLILDRSNGAGVDVGRTEMQQTIDAAPSEIKQAVTVLLNEEFAVLSRDPNAGQIASNPDVAQSGSAYKSWSDSHCH